MITYDEFKGRFNKKVLATESAYELLVNFDGDSEALLDSVITYQDAVGKSRYSGEEYIKAIMYCSLVLVGKTQVIAYTATYPNRAEGKSENWIQVSASSFHRSKLVQSLINMMTIPTHMMFMSYEHKGLKVLHDVMTGDGYDKDKVAAAVGLLNHIEKSKPKDMNIAMKVDVRNSGIDELNSLLSDVSTKQIEAIESGRSAQDILDADIIKTEDEVVLNG